MVWCLLERDTKRNRERDTKRYKERERERERKREREREREMGKIRNVQKERIINKNRQIEKYRDRNRKEGNYESELIYREWGSLRVLSFDLKCIKRLFIDFAEQSLKP